MNRVKHNNDPLSKLFSDADSLEEWDENAIFELANDPSHIEPDLFMKMREGTISRAERGQVLQHTATCAFCRHQLALVARLVPSGEKSTSVWKRASFLVGLREKVQRTLQEIDARAQKAVETFTLPPRKRIVPALGAAFADVPAPTPLFRQKFSSDDPRMYWIFKERKSNDATQASSDLVVIAEVPLENATTTPDPRVLYLALCPLEGETILDETLLLLTPGKPGWLYGESDLGSLEEFQAIIVATGQDHLICTPPVELAPEEIGVEDVPLLAASIERAPESKRAIWEHWIQQSSVEVQKALAEILSDPSPSNRPDM